MVTIKSYIDMVHVSDSSSLQLPQDACVYCCAVVCRFCSCFIVLIQIDSTVASITFYMQENCQGLCLMAVRSHVQIHRAAEIQTAKKLKYSRCTVMLHLPIRMAP